MSADRIAWPQWSGLCAVDAGRRFPPGRQPGAERCKLGILRPPAPGGQEADISRRTAFCGLGGFIGAEWLTPRQPPPPWAPRSSGVNTEEGHVGDEECRRGRSGWAAYHTKNEHKK